MNQPTPLPSPVRRLGSRGFTLFELMIVLGILAVLGAVALPQIIGTMPQYRLRAEARELASNFKKARLEAVKRGREVIIQFPDPLPGNTYIIFTDLDGDRTYDQNQDELLVSWAMRPQTMVASTNFANNRAGYNSRGLSVGNIANREVTLCTANGLRGYILTLSIAGNINLQDVKKTDLPLKCGPFTP